MSQIKPEPTVKSETAFHGNLIEVRTDTVRLPGGETTVREIVVHPEVVAIIPVLDDGRLVFVRQFRKAAERVLLELPAGGIDPGETPDQAVRREMVEETGYRVGQTRHLVSFFTSPGFTTEYMHLYTASGLQQGRPTEQTDQIELERLSLQKALDGLTRGEMADAKTILALLLYARDLELRSRSGG